MSDRDEATGQFSSAEPLSGLAGIESEAGYVPLPDENKEEQEDLTPREAAEQYAARSTPQADIKTYSALDDLPDDVTLTIDQAVKIKTDIDAADRAEAEDAAADKLRKEVDELRGVKPEAEEGTKRPTEEARPLKEGELDPELERALNNPKVKEALASQISEAETVKQTYSKAVDVANDLARASFIENFPEIAALPLNQWEGALAAMANQEPARFNRAIGTLNRVVQLQAAQQQQQAQRNEAEQTRLKAETARFEEKIRDVPKTQRADIEKEIVTALEERGANMKDVVTFLRSSEASSSAVMELLWELGDTRAQLKAIKNAPKAVATRSLPPVQRPGVSSSRSSGDASDIAALDRRLSASGNIKDALALYTAQSRARARG